jgi:hypothetical protein
MRKFTYLLITFVKLELLKTVEQFLNAHTILGFWPASNASAKKPEQFFYCKKICNSKNCKA